MTLFRGPNQTVAVDNPVPGDTILVNTGDLYPNTTTTVTVDDTPPDPIEVNTGDLFPRIISTLGDTFGDANLSQIAILINETGGVELNSSTSPLAIRTAIGAGISNFDGSYLSLSNIPTFATVATTGDYDDLSNRPTLFSGSYPDLTNIPTDLVRTSALADYTLTADLADVATSGDYNDLSNPPTLFSGDYGDLANIPTNLVRTGDITDVLRYSPQSLSPARQLQSRTNIGAGTSNFSGSYGDLSGIPTNIAVDSDFTYDSSTEVLGLPNNISIDLGSIGTVTLPDIALTIDSGGNVVINTDTSATALRTALGAASTTLATSSNDGLMPRLDKSKLDGIAAGADVTPGWVPGADPNYLTDYDVTATDVQDVIGSIADDTIPRSKVDGVDADVPAGAVFTDTMYSNGDGLSLTAREFSVDNTVIRTTSDINDLNNVNASPSPGDYLVWNSGGTAWEAAPPPTADDINDLMDVDTATDPPMLNYILKWDGNNWVPSAKFVADEISGNYIDGDTIQQRNMATGSVGEDELRANSVTHDKMADSSVGRDELIGDAVNQDKIANDSIRREHILDGEVTFDKLHDGAVHGDKINDRGIESDKLNFNLDGIPDVSTAATAAGDYLVRNAGNDMWEPTSNPDISTFNNDENFIKQTDVSWDSNAQLLEIGTLDVDLSALGGGGTPVTPTEHFSFSVSPLHVTEASGSTTDITVTMGVSGTGFTYTGYRNATVYGPAALTTAISATSGTGTSFTFSISDGTPGSYRVTAQILSNDSGGNTLPAHSANSTITVAPNWLTASRLVAPPALTSTGVTDRGAFVAPEVMTFTKVNNENLFFLLPTRSSGYIFKSGLLFLPETEVSTIGDHTVYTLDDFNNSATGSTLTITIE